MKNFTMLAAMVLSLGGRAAADSFAVVVPDGTSTRKQPAAYWQLNYSPPQQAYNYSISLETGDLDELENTIYSLAEKMGVPKNPQQYAYGRGSSNRMLSFYPKADKAEAFCQKLITLARLKNYSASSNRSDTTLKEIRKKTELIAAELEGKSGLFEKLPIAETLMSDLLAKHKNYLNMYENSKDKAAVTVSINLKPKD